MLLTVFDTPSERTHIEDELLSIVYPNLLTHPVSALPAPRSPDQYAKTGTKTAERDGIPLYDFVYNRFFGQTGQLKSRHRNAA